jgi:phosphate transport system substrate-binding protein
MKTKRRKKGEKKMKKMKRIVTLLLVCILIAGAFSACTNNSSKDQGNTNTQDNTQGNTGTEENTTGSNDLNGSISMAGSTSMEKLANAAAEAFMTKYPGVIISPEFIGSTAGIEALNSGTVQIGNASRGLNDTEKAAGIVENVVAIDGIAVITEKTNTVANLTKDQLAQIYTGTINNWSQVGGADQPIVVVGRESGSGTRGAFEELLEVVDKCKYANEINSTGGVMAKVASTPGSIGYVSLDVLDETVVALNIDNVEPTEDNIKAGSYALSRPFVMATKGEISEQNDLVKAFFEYLKSDEGKDLIKNVGLITVD